MDEIEEFKDQVKKGKEPSKLPYKQGLSTGSTLLNLACTGRPAVGFLPGYYYFIVGDSNSGKTFLSLTCLAEAAINPQYKDYRFIYDNAEDGALMDLRRFFGKGVADRIEPPLIARDTPQYSSSVEEFYYNVDDAVSRHQPFIYILDSMDSLSSEDEVKKFQEHKKAFLKKKAKEEEGEEDTKEEKVAGSYGDGKAKKNSSHLRRVIADLRETGSILLIINQTRDNIGAFTFEKKTRSGGHALRFYATLEMWSSGIGKIQKVVRGEKRQVGVNCQIHIKKNRVTGKERKVDVPIYHSYGIDDIGSCVDFLIEEKHWNKSGQSVVAKEFSFKGKRDTLIEQIESNNQEKELRQLVAEVWNDIEEQCQLNRKKRYD